MINFITEHIDIWTAAQIQKNNSGRGRGKNSNDKTPHGIKKLRELILELAVRGKLEPQDPNDEPASELLEKIAKEKERLIKEGKIKKQKLLPEISEDEKPFDLPFGWEWVRFQDVSTYIQRGKGPKYADEGKVKVISQKCIQWSGFNLSKARFVDDDSLNAYQPERFLECNDLLWNSTGTGTVGRINILSEVKPNTLVADSHVTVIRPLQVSSDFLRCYVAAPGIQLRIEPEHENSLVSGTTKQVELNTRAVQPLLVPVPPLSEQHRIVAKVDELMALCDQLEQQQTDSNAAHQTLVETLLKTLTSAAEQGELEAAWQRIANHFGSLFTTEQSIDQLKQTILQLAVMGKLVPQDSHDEPASVLLGKIAKEKARLIKKGKIKKQKPFPEISEDEKPFELPGCWEWVRLGELSILKGGLAYKSSVFSDSGKHQVIRMGNIRPDYLRLNVKPAYIPDDLAEVTSEYQIELNDILITMTGTKGKKDYLYSLIVRPEYLEVRKLYLNQRLCIVKGLLLVNDFLNMVIKDDRLLDVIYAQSTGTANQANIGMVAISNWVLPLPPIKEQHRIVAKVDELMTLCDTLKARLSNAQTTQLQLADVIVEQAIA